MAGKNDCGMAGKGWREMGGGKWMAGKGGGETGGGGRGGGSGGGRPFKKKKKTI